MEGFALAGSRRIKNKLIFNISCTLIVLIACFGIISLLTAKNSFSNDTEDKWDGVTVASSFSAGNGDKDNPYIINNGAELAYFKYLIEGENSNIYNSKYYELGQNINLDNHEWSPIGNNNYFKGNFNGNGYSIKNAKIVDGVVIDNYVYYGFFSRVGDAFLKNINFNNIVVSPNSSTSVYKIGSIVGEVMDSSVLANISISNSKMDLGNITNDKDNAIGGVVALLSKESKFYNIYINLDFSTNEVLNVGKAAYNSLCDSSYIITNITSNSLFVDSTSNYVNSTSKNTDQYIYSDPNYVNIISNSMISGDELVNLLNNYLDDGLYWKYEAGNLVINKKSNSINTLNAITTFSFSANNPIVLHDSGI